MQKFPELPMFQGNNAPFRAELDIHDLEVEGDLPELDGIFYRMAADHQYAPRFHDDVPFNADGSITRFLFKDGRVHLRHRYVQTERFKLERAAGRALFGKYRNPFLDDPSVQGKDRNLANTTPVVFNKTLYALREDSPPVAMDPITLETRGNENFAGTFQFPTFTAHPKLDPHTGQWIAFGFASKGLFTRDVTYYEIGADGKVTHTVEFQAPYHCMMHDFGVTQDYAVFPIIPLCGVGEENLKAGKPHYAWDPHKEVYLGVLPRGGKAADLRWFKAPNQFCSHVMNAFNDGRKVYIDVPVAAGNLFPFFPELGKPWDPTKVATTLTRWCVDLDAPGEGFKSAQPLSDFGGEFPRTDHRYQTRPYRHGWMLGFDFVRTSLAHIDHQAGKTGVWHAPEGTMVEEPCFVPRRPGSAEGDGFILQAAVRAAERRTVVNVFEAQRVTEGPIATILLPVRLHPGYHGTWSDLSEVTMS